MNKPRFSIICPSYLGFYKNCATDRENKLIRAIKSVQDQTFTEWELVIIADGCEKTFSIVRDVFHKDERISCSLIPKQKLWSGQVRNRGLVNASGDYIVYLDTDDKFGTDHLQIINQGIYDSCHKSISFNRVVFGAEPAWCFFDDYVWSVPLQEFRLRKCDPKTLGKCGTSNIVHKSGLNVFWNSGYKHDWLFIGMLETMYRHVRLADPQYYVCHLPKKYDI